MQRLVKTIPVRNAHGDEPVLFVFKCGWGKQLALCTGEVAEQVNRDTFELIANGEKLSAIKRRDLSH